MQAWEARLEQSGRKRAAIILAAGMGTRMKSSLPKVMHQVAHRPMVDWSVALARSVGCDPIICVLSPNAPSTIEHIETMLGHDAIAIQSPAQGTGDAVRCAEGKLAGFAGDVVVLYGDSPLIPESAITDLFAALDTGASIGVLGFEAAEPGGYGRLILGADGGLDRIVEAKEASPDELAVTFCNSGVMAGSADAMFRHLAKVTNENAKGEYYLTDVVGIAREAGERVAAVSCDEDDVLGVNSRVELAQAEAAFQRRRRHELLASGVTMTDPDSVFLAHDTEIGNDVIVEPNVVFGPGVRIETGATIRAFSHLEGCHVSSGAIIGPYARLRPGAEIGENAKVGNFVEVKNVSMAAGAKANHLAYLGDGSVGAGANIGAGTIFCNYDGFNKATTTIGEGAFVGSNSALVAPVTIGDGAYVGSGSVVTTNVPENSLAVARGRQRIIEDWATGFRAKQKG